MIAIGLLLVVVILIVVGVHSCTVSARNNSLRDYNNNVSTLIQESNQTGAQMFGVLSNPSGAGGAVELQSRIAEAATRANSQLKDAKSMNVPDEVKGAQQNLVTAMQMRSDGISHVANQIQPALSNATSKDAINQIAADMANFYASDVLYKNYTLPLIAGALKNAGIATSGPNAQTFNGEQFLPDVRWLTPSFVADQLHVSIATPGGKPTPGLHGHSLDTVTVNGTSLQTGSTNTLSASPPPTFQLNFTNGGTNSEHNISCKVTVSNTSISGKTSVAQTTPGQHASCQVTLNASPPAGNYTVTATIGKVAGEHNVQNNTMTFPVTFQ
ncbi:MAG TPA: hypothetical protein VGF93_12245 [Solirubrobacteraceae bacterium]|jgi:hypothetical protein